MLAFNDYENKKELAYFLGFFWADGTINCGKYLVIEILKEDADDISHIFSKVLDFRITNRHRIGRQEQSVFFCKDKDFADFLKEMGKYPHTEETHEKIMTWIGEDYLIYFLRGLIDGDGCFYSHYGSKRNINEVVTHFTIAASYDQDWDYLCDVCKKYGLSLKIIRRVHNKKSKSSIVRCSNFGDIQDFINALYEVDDGIYLKRKKDKAFFLIEEHEKHVANVLKNRKKYKITKTDGSTIVVDNLKKYARENQFCYDRMCVAANKGNGYYKGMKIEKV